MSVPVFVQLDYQSRYSLLGAMAREIADALADRGALINPPDFTWGAPNVAGGHPGIILWMNFLADVSDLRSEVAGPGSKVSLIQFFVDHPLALWPEQLDTLSRLDNFRMLLPCLDGVHLLRLRWPRLKYVHCLHGVAPAALAPRESIAAPRPTDLVVMGSIHTEAEIAALRAQIPARLHRRVDDTARLLFEHPWMTFEHAAELTLTPTGALVGDWPFLACVWRCVTADVNRRRRVSLVKAMEGVRIAVHGAEAWKEFCRGGASAPERSTIEYRGDLPYTQSAEALAGARACLAWGPTQFTHSFSERLLLSLAAGCATIADDRLLTRRHFGCEDASGSRVLPMEGSTGSAADARPITARVFDAGDPEEARHAVEALLADPDRCASMGLAGRDEIARAHLWAHRVGLIATVSGAAMAA